MSCACLSLFHGRSSIPLEIGYSDGGFQDVLGIVRGCFWVNSELEAPIGFAVVLRDKDLVLGIDTF
jgi:hypothetical protein